MSADASWPYRHPDLEFVDTETLSEEVLEAWRTRMTAVLPDPSEYPSQPDDALGLRRVYGISLMKRAEYGARAKIGVVLQDFLAAITGGNSHHRGIDITYPDGEGVQVKMRVTTKGSNGQLSHDTDHLIRHVYLFDSTGRESHPSVKQLLRERGAPMDSLDRLLAGWNPPSFV